MKERMSHEFAVFNLHVNNAGNRADREFKAQFGQDAFDDHIAPLRKDGIMAIFAKGEDDLDTLCRGAWVALCTAYVNEKIPYRLTPDGPVPVKNKRSGTQRKKVTP